MEDKKVVLDSGSSEELEQGFSSNGNGYDTVATKKLIRKIDFVLIPWLALLYLLSFLDRTNIGNARLAGLETDLNMSGLDYNVALAIFFPFYVAAEIPSNIMMKRSRPSLWIPSIMIAWAVVCSLMGLVQNYAGLLVARAALGIAEGGLFPGVTFYITMWYKRHECGLRMAIFFSAATAAGAFGGLLARGIGEMDGIGGKGGWAWIFIIEGILTFVIAKFLTSAEKAEVQRRLEEDRSSLADEYNMKFFWDAIKDWKIWVHMFVTVGVYTPLYSFSLFLPTIVSSLGYENEEAQLMTVPPYVVACVFCIGGGFLADRQGQRGIYMIGFNIVAIIGFIMLISSDNNGVKYAGTFFAASGIYPNVPQGVAWNGNNIGGSFKRSVGIAMHVGCGNLGGVLSSFIYRSQDKPHYRVGHGTLIGCLTMSTVLCTIMTIYLRRENARRDREYKPPAEYSEAERAAEREKGDDASFFRYTI
ncbi:hypothetical protein AN8955.2 [Aspergillus nidulans FGSC A4]|uniref:Major facilitator superfamily (MFS) profile domain-containing protein n=1 Tax=Emericella nidulans (strain FGSC A4 / ATCC 38163 / CBS 112.46 / NRRL 194 / M139) TaxID=227321 RepID=Q5ARX5_EMENI|nr:hypothetical protein [Aspergillus nidulans FGSC A4]EAA63750.1 hypothetical protein AN8955.2 [Aspergillus nidulans FGSC A4]CBF84576.1 TPA: hypothetical protein ANIA_08955 [Aspergillus nidulans FGSC A4]|eukprot:XP_682224.1 hypothetical protein AN8955.2 [Aspergillus nidulans FGSC A4]